MSNRYFSSHIHLLGPKPWNTKFFILYILQKANPFLKNHPKTTDLEVSQLLSGQTNLRALGPQVCRGPPSREHPAGEKRGRPGEATAQVAQLGATQGGGEAVRRSAVWGRSGQVSRLFLISEGEPNINELRHLLFWIYLLCLFVVIHSFPVWCFMVVRFFARLALCLCSWCWHHDVVSCMSAFFCKDKDIRFCHFKSA